MKFSIILSNVGPSFYDLGSDDRQYPNAEAAFKAQYPNANIIDAEYDADDPYTCSICAVGEDGTCFVAQISPVFDGSENAAADAIGRKLGANDWGKTTDEIIAANAPRETVRERLTREKNELEEILGSHCETIEDADYFGSMLSRVEDRIEALDIQCDEYRREARCD